VSEQGLGARVEGWGCAAAPLYWQDLLSWVCSDTPSIAVLNGLEACPLAGRGLGRRGEGTSERGQRER